MSWVVVLVKTTDVTYPGVQGRKATWVGKEGVHPETPKQPKKTIKYRSPASAKYAAPLTIRVMV